jgi:hypothetical protein
VDVAINVNVIGDVLNATLLIILAHQDVLKI